MGGPWAPYEQILTVGSQNFLVRLMVCYCSQTATLGQKCHFGPKMPVSGHTAAILRATLGCPTGRQRGPIVSQPKCHMRGMRAIVCGHVMEARVIEEMWRSNHKFQERRETRPHRTPPGLFWSVPCVAEPGARSRWAGISAARGAVAERQGYRTAPRPASIGRPHA